MITTDVLVIGGGGAACRAAIEAADNGVKVIMTLKGKLGVSGATAYQISEMAGYNCGDGATDSTDNKEEHLKDIMDAAAGMADEKVARVVADNACSSVAKLEEWGVNFEKIDGRYYTFKSCFSNKSRTHVIKGHGEPIMKAMINLIRKKDIEVFEDFIIVKLIVVDNVCIGAIGIHNGEYINISAKSVIIATGGAGQAFQRNMNPQDITGDGYVLGFDAGADLVNMEFMQAGIGISHPVISLLNAYIWGALPEVTNSLGNKFIHNYLPEGLTEKDVLMDHRKHFPFSSSDNSLYLEVSIQKEIQNGRGTENGGVYLDLTKFTDDYVEQFDNDCGLHYMWPIARDYFYSRGLKVLDNKVEIACFAHAINGGLKINEFGETSIKGLYAAGEAAGGPHGADRLGGNMIMTGQVFGEVTGRKAAFHAKKSRNFIDITLFNKHIKSLDKYLYSNIDTWELTNRLQKLTQKNLLIARNEKGLVDLFNGIKEIESLFENSGRGSCSIKNFELYCMLKSVKIMTTAALQRKESRGSHFREDYPHLDERFGDPLILNKNNTTI